MKFLHKIENFAAEQKFVEEYLLKLLEKMLFLSATHQKEGNKSKIIKYLNYFVNLTTSEENQNQVQIVS